MSKYKDWMMTMGGTQLQLRCGQSNMEKHKTITMFVVFYFVSFLGVLVGLALWGLRVPRK